MSQDVTFSVNKDGQKIQIPPENIIHFDDLTKPEEIKRKKIILHQCMPSFDWDISEPPYIEFYCPACEKELDSGLNDEEKKALATLIDKLFQAFNVAKGL